MTCITRRAILGGLAGAAAAPFSAQSAAHPILIRGAYVMTRDRRANSPRPTFS